MTDLPSEALGYFEKDSRLSRLLPDVIDLFTDYERFPHHSMKEHYRRVLRNAVNFAHEEHLEEEKILILVCAALIHDIGYHLPRGKEVTHHRASCAWVRENLGKYGYANGEIEIIAQAVLCHDHKYGDPPDDIGKILHDADTIDKASITGRLFGVAVDPSHPLRREVAHKITSRSDIARAYLLRLSPLPDGEYFYTAAGKKSNAGRIELVRKVFETYLAEEEGTVYRLE
jgi:hypothetical protein